MIWLISLLAAMASALLVWVLAEASAHLAAQGKHQEGLKRLEQQLAALFLFVDVRKLVLLNLALMGLVTVGVWLLARNPVLPVLVPVLFLLAPGWGYRFIRVRRQKQFEQQLPDAIQSLSGALKAGASLNAGFMQLAQESSPPLSQEVELIIREQRLGVSLDSALSNLGRRMPLPTVVLLVSTIRIAAETGGELAEALSRTATTMRSIAQAEGKIAALTAQGKMQAWVVGLLPMLLLYVLSRMEPVAMAKLWTTTLGWGVIAVIVFLEFMGVWLIRRIVAIDV